MQKEIDNRDRSGRVYVKQSRDFPLMGDIKRTIEYLKKHLTTAIENGDRSQEGGAYGSLGNAYQLLGNYRKAIEYHEKYLKIAIEIGDRNGEGRAYGSLGNVYESLGDYRRAIEYHEKHLKIAIEIGDRGGEGNAYGNLGNAYDSLGDYRKAIKYHKKTLNFAIKIGHRNGEGRAYGSLGNAYQSLGDYRRAIEYHKKHLKIATEIGDQGGEGGAYGNLGNAFISLGDYRRGIEYLEKDLKIAREIGDRGGEGGAYGSLGNAYQSLVDYRRAIKYHKKHLKLATEIGDRGGEGGAYGNLGNAYDSLGDYRNAIEYHVKHLKIAIEIGDREGEGTAYHNIGKEFFSLEEAENAVDNFVSAVDVFNSLRSLLKSQDNWKINFREVHEATYNALWLSLLRIKKIDEALFAAEQGRAQTLSDNLLLQYKLNSSSSSATIDTKKTILRLLTKLSSPTLFLAIKDFTTNIWFLRKGRKILFRQGRLEGNRAEKDPLLALLKSSLAKIGAEDTKTREDGTLDDLDNECSFSIGVRGEGDGKPSSPPLDNPFKPFYDAVIGPILDMLEPQDDELVIVPDGALCFTPWAAVFESIRIRIVPSLTSYQLILSVAEGHHKKKGALLVGNPCLKQLKKPLADLPFAQKEVEMIASILKTKPLTGIHATKAEVMERMSSVALIHIAAHGDARTGEINLSPGPGWSSKFPHRKDYILRMSDVQTANLRTRLVVLSCCHSGRGRVLKGEGVVGIARAFLAAGARSVLVALWAINDEATVVFMKRFYQHLKEGKTASAAVQQAMKFLRESEQFYEMKYWAPFQLIGDDVKIEFEADHE